MEYGYHGSVGTPNCNLNMLDKLHKRVCVAAGTTLAAALATLVHFQNVTGLSFLYRY